MSLIVQKFGGSSVATDEKVRNVAKVITDTYKKGNNVIAVVSAQGDTTDELIEKANAINPNASKREMDVLLSAGEQISASLLAMAIEKMDFPVISLLGWQAGFSTNSVYGSARIKNIDTERLTSEIAKNNIVIVAGFQGIDKRDNITTFGRGGSDTTAVAIAAAVGADKCQIFTDVEGVFVADPRKIPTAPKLDEITYDEMLELATLGAQVLNNRSVEMAKKYNIEVEVLSSITNKPGTKIKEVIELEKMLIRGVTKDTDVSRIAVIKLPDVPGIAFKMFSKLAQKNINVDIILQSVGRDGTKDISFTVQRSHGEEAKKLLLEAFSEIDDDDIFVDNNVAKVSVVGAGMESHPAVASDMFEALYSANVNIQMIATSEIKISVLINEEDADKAVRAVYDKFFPNN
ncbi:MAG: aspartate kinase [Clostridia bacterium]|nr:aspartate kinase [Clostridia bacterium]